MFAPTILLAPAIFVLLKLKHVKSRISLFRAKFDLKNIHYNCL